MNFTLTRQSFNSWGIVSKLESEDGSSVFWTLEHAFLQPDGSYKPVLDDGPHECQLGTHQLDHGPARQLYEILGIPGHSGVLFHQGNYNSDSDACCLVGNSLDEANEMICDSVDALDRFMAIQAGQPFIVNVVTSDQS